MRRLVPLLLCLVLALSGLCTFTCFAQVTQKDSHACCHGKVKGEHSLMVVKSQPATIGHQDLVAVQPYQTVAFAMPVVADVQPQRFIRPPVFRTTPLLTLRI
jgi:hypothetical protein